MKILIYGAEPNVASAHSSIGFKLAEEYVKNKNEVYYLYEVSLYTHSLYEYSSDGIMFIPCLCHEENTPVNRFSGNVILFVFKKLFTKILNCFSNHVVLNKFFSRKIDMIVKKNNIDLIICCGNKQRPYVIPFVKSKCHKIVLFHEIPFCRNLKIDSILLGRLMKKKVMMGVRQVDMHFFPPLYKRNIINIEFPLLYDSPLNQDIARIDKVFCYFGKLYNDIRNPAPLFELMDVMKEYKLFIYGSDYDYSSINIPSNVFFVNGIPNKRIKEETANISAFVMLENTNTFLKSSKLIELMNYGKPIIVIGEVLNTYFQEIIDYKKIIFYKKSDNEIDIKNKIISATKRKPIFMGSSLEKHKISFVAKRIISVFDN